MGGGLQGEHGRSGRELNFSELRALRQGLYDELEEKRKAMNSQTAKQEGIMQRWIWGWGSSWSTQPNAPQGQASPPLSSSPPPIDEDELRDIIGDQRLTATCSREITFLLFSTLTSRAVL
ncbi:hypothetical protein BSL78_04182 [Apostichopus japonicus]|uniref:Uncharacterized protein n=1 Tax=Stichopus japonicus TaxID=307972 RepID=A0A2G8LFD4_STIJA|nr:hypothetical protein BSL78_04182 [Apostichopus japonicus]